MYISKCIFTLQDRSALRLWHSIAVILSDCIDFAFVRSAASKIDAKEIHWPVQGLNIGRTFSTLFTLDLRFIL